MARGQRPNDAAKPARAQLVQLIKERGPLQLSGRTKLLGRVRRFKEAMRAKRLRSPTPLGLFVDSSQTARGNRQLQGERHDQDQWPRYRESEGATVA